MQPLVYALMATVPFVVFSLILRFLVSMQGWPVGLVGTFARLVTLPLLAAWVLSTGRGWRRLAVGGVAGWVLLMGSLSIGINLLWFSALKWTTATNVSMLFRLDLVFVVLIGGMLGLERIGKAQLAILPLMFLGLGLLTEVHKLDFGGHLAGDLMIVTAALGFATNAFVIRRIMRVMDEESAALYNHAMSMLGFVALAVFGGDFARAGEVFAQRSAWLPIVSLGVIGAVGLPLYYAALRRMDVWKLRTFMLCAPVIAAVAEWSLWGFRLSGLQCLGGLIILLGLGLLIRVESRSGDARVEEVATEGVPESS
jgi:drug/metabolite transporter (DMT)-like permease